MMKIAALTVLVLMVSGLAHAQSYTPPPPGTPAWERNDSSPNPIDHYPDRDIPGHAPRYGGGIAIASCAPEVVQGNVAATERTLTAVSATPAFASAVEFKSLIGSIAATKNQQAKVAKYFAMIGVDASKSADVADFVGAREIRAQWLSSLERSGHLTSSQADTVARQLQAALRGSLQ